MKIPAINPQPSAYRYGATYKSTTAIAAGGTEQVFSAAANVNGAYVWDAFAATASAGRNSGAYLAKATAPTTIIDGDMVQMSAAVGAGEWSQITHLPQPVFIPAGKGLFWFSTQLEVSPIRGVNFTLL